MSFPLCVAALEIPATAWQLNRLRAQERRHVHAAMTAGLSSDLAR